ncbi:hypothetical protein [Pseudomonas japonica]|uniref:hypothetical protein n=1 Tax=Pseudomonas japonica TaxID=256466 RepID=UPI0012EE9F19|nr:hypothetical protein [Pseudomonas japonica]
MKKLTILTDSGIQAKDSGYRAAERASIPVRRALRGILQYCLWTLVEGSSLDRTSRYNG